MPLPSTPRRPSPAMRLLLACRPTGSVAGLVALAGLVLLLTLPPAAGADAAVPPVGLAAGSLVIVGGGALPDAVRDCFLELAGGKKARVVVIPTASIKAERPDLLRTPAVFRAQGARVTVLHARSREEANRPDFVKPLADATGVWFSGGAQSRLVEAYRGTLVEQELHKVLARGGVIAGTSAGAAVMSEVMIAGGTKEAVVRTGFGFLPGVVVDQHFQNRHRLDRLLGVLARYPQCPGVGIDEQTAIVVTGHTFRVVGNGEVRVCLAAAGTEKPNVQVLRAGGRGDLAELCHTALAHVHPAAPPVRGASMP